MRQTHIDCLMAYTAVPGLMTLRSSPDDTCPIHANDWRTTRFPKRVSDQDLTRETDEVDLGAQKKRKTQTNKKNYSFSSYMYLYIHII